MIHIEEWNGHYTKMWAAGMRILRRMWRFLVRMDVVAILIFLILLLATIGSFFPQTSPALENDPSQTGLWLDQAQDRYGILTNALTKIGAFKLFRTPYFIAILTLLIISTLLCTLDRWRALWRRSFHPTVQCPDITFSTTPHSSQLNTIHTENMEKLLYDHLSTRGYKVKMARTDEAIYLRGDHNRFSPLGTLISHLGAVILVLGVLLSNLLGWQEELIVHPYHPTQPTTLTSLALIQDGFTIERYADGSASDYVAQIRLIPKDGPERHQSLRVNQPIHDQGVTIHLQGYQQVGEDYLLSLLIVHDPGYPLVLAAAFLILLGMTTSFNFPHRCIHIKLEKDGSSYLAGRADRRAYDFDNEFKTFVEELRQSKPTAPE
jgi:cytochrome c biogenesis protein